MEENEEKELYEGFDLSEYLDEDKAKAIINFLGLNGETDTLSEDDDEYTVNPRHIKHGSSPAEYEEEIKCFKALLTPKQRDMVNSYLKLTSILEYCECGKVKDKLYKKICTSLDKLKDSKDKTVKENYAYCEKHAGYVANILHHLLWLPDHSEKTSWHTPETEAPSHVKNYWQAWFGQKVIDYREAYWESDGVYLVLTDSEADRRDDQYYDDGEMEYMWRQAVESKNTLLGYDDWVDDIHGNSSRGESLATYDGVENYEEVDGEDYYIYRTN